ncbi:hypothetical protein Cni_G10502 [Canna indica]|uniref:Uncharacterized protein n=1 Tax=Canna indica TaxID=4628 RepID=A0AAQ3QAQ5_9LILI|nr:hypothetical protein Cni_G10502 [Canna indica]
MKIRASSFLKHMFSVVVEMVKAKSSAMKSKTSAFKARLLVLGLLHQNKKVLMKAINSKILALMGGREKGEGDTHSAEDDSKAIVLYDAAKSEAPMSPTSYIEPAYYNGDDDDDDDNYPDLRHSLFDLEDEEDDDELGNATGSVIDLVRNSKDGAEFSLEDEIDHVADVFIKRFHKQMKMQKLESFKRYQEMLQRGV